MISLRYLTVVCWHLALLLAVLSCQTVTDEPQGASANKFEDSVIATIYDYQDKRSTSDLLAFFNDENPIYRTEAALALGSVQDSVAIPILAHLLSDTSPKVRKAAAYALGQSYDSSAVAPLVRALQTEDSLYVRRELYEALGKVIMQPQIQLLYQQPDQYKEEKEGMAWGLYRAGIRNVYDSAVVELIVSYLDSANSYETRLAAAHFLARTSSLNLKPYEKQILTAAQTDPVANVRMAAVDALGKVETDKAQKALQQSARSDADYRVRSNSVIALAKFPFDQVKQTAIAALSDSNTNVAIAAAAVIDMNATTDDEVLDMARAQSNKRIRARLYGTSLRVADDDESIINEIKAEYEGSTDPYYKAGLLNALSNSLQAYEFIITKTFADEHAAISTAGIGALAKLRKQEEFPEKLKPAFADIFAQAIESGDIAMVAITAELLGDPKFNFKDEYDSIGFLHQAKKQLSLPKDNEALQVLNRTIAYFEGKDKLPETKNDFNNPIDWDLVKTISKDQLVKIKTEKGDILLRLLVENAPGSVANFVRLSKEGYFNGKNFHRVVPNFVIQGGCNRGDGYGGEDFSIRSELANLRYQEGSVGMASAGKDTEGTQWFITHSPTPHLDGRYTIFAQVTDGMDVVHQMEEGDIIKSVELM